MQCTNCDYAANTEAVEIAAPGRTDPADASADGGARHPGHPDDRHAGRAADSARPSDRRSRHAEERRAQDRPPGSTTWELLVVGVPGDREVDLKRLAGQLEPVEVEQAGAGRPRGPRPALVKGYIGPQILGADAKMRYLVDPLVVEGTAWVTGANERGQARRATSCAAGTSRRTVRSARSRSATATAARAAARAARSRAASSWATCSSSGRKYAEDVRADRARTRTASR